MDEAREADSAASSLAEPDAPRNGGPMTETLASGSRQRRLVTRLVIAVGASAILCSLLYLFAAPGLPGRTDIVGYPTFANYNFERSFWAYRLTVYAFPIFAIAGYILLARIGPLKSRTPRATKRTIELVEPKPAAPPTPERASWSTWARILLPAAVVVMACGARTGHIDFLAIGAGVAYVALVTGIAEVWARHNASQRLVALSTANGVSGAVAAVLSLWFVSAHTVVQTATGTRSWPWLAWWIPVLGIAGIAWWAPHQLRRGRAAHDVELTLLTVVVGAIALFLALSILPGPITHFQGYDDAHDMVGASLAAGGYFPWRDMLFIHGLFPDVLTGSLGRAIFGDSVWGVFTVHTVILIPLVWVSAYLFAVWVSRRNAWFLGLIFLVMVVGLRPMLWIVERSMGQPVALLQWPERFVALPVTLIVLGETLRRRSVAWAVGFTLLLFVQEILAPETIFVAVPALGCVVAADLVHRRPERNLWNNLRLTRWCIGTALFVTAAWAAYLAAVGALRAFIEYYLVVGPGHNLTAAYPPTDVTLLEYTMLAINVLCVLITVWAIAIKVAIRDDWDAYDWVAVAAAAFLALYLEKSLARFDPVHVWQAFIAGLPLFLLWSWRLLNHLGHVLANWRRKTDSRLTWFAHPVTAVLVLLIALGLIFVGPLRKVEQQHYVPTATEASSTRVGYASPGAIDTGMVRDLDTAIRTYAGDDGPVFDMTNSLGYLYYLLGRAPGTRFIHVDLAASEYAQRLLIAELKAVRPPVVIYDATSIGLATWDGISGDVRHYDVSEYVLRGWTPVLRTHGVLVMARNDLVASRRVPALSTPPQTEDLYFSGPACDWGAVPNFLPVPASDRATTLQLLPAVPRTIVNFSGWAVDPATNHPASTVLFADGERVVGSTTPSIDRPDVAAYLHQPSSASGFHYSASFDAPVRLSAYLLGADGLAHPLRGAPPGSAAVLRLSDGSAVTVTQTSGGYLDAHSVDAYSAAELKLPSGMNLRDYDLATLSSSSGLGGANVILTDRPAYPYHTISARWLDKAGPNLTLRVGSCPQWYGFDPSKPLYVMQSGGPPVTSVTLSAMRGTFAG